MGKHPSIYTFHSLFLLISLPVTNLVTASDIHAHVPSETGDHTVFVGETGSIGQSYSFAKFLGIRYGEPPVGEKRFQNSSLYKYKEDIVSAKTHGNICPQTRKDNSLIAGSDVMDEDCLFLNVLVPLDNYVDTQSVQNVSEFAQKKAVYVFIHGGVFIRGTGNFFLFDYQTLATSGDVIVVTINYRLGFLGFLATDDGVMPANLGLWDQQMALRWVKENIEAFGGDKSRITVGGQSAGSMSAILQSFYEGNNDIFQNTIAQSASPFALKIISEKGFPTTLKVAKMAGCIFSSKGIELSNDILECLRGKPVNDLIKLPTPNNLGPVLDNDFISKETQKLCPQTISRFNVPKSISPAFASKNLLTGFTSDDGEIVYELYMKKFAQDLGIANVKAFLAKPITQGIFRFLIKGNLIPLKDSNTISTKVVMDSIMEFYSVLYPPSNRVAICQSAVSLLSDIYFVNPTLKHALLHSKANSCGRVNSSDCNNRGATYLYRFRLPLTNAFTTSNELPWFKGSRHGSDLFFLGDIPVRNSEPALSGFMVTAWTNFIKTGNPNPSNSDEWKEYTQESQDMFELTDTPAPMKATEYTKELHFWNKYLPQLMDDLHTVNASINCGKSSDNNSGFRLEMAMGNVLIIVSFVISVGKLL